MVGTGHSGFLLPVVDWMGWWFTTSFGTKEKQETVSKISCWVVPPVGGWYSVVDRGLTIASVLFDLPDITPIF